MGDMTGERIIAGSRPKNFIAERTYPKGKKRFYFQFYPWGDMRFKAGWLGNGRYELAFRERKL